MFLNKCIEPTERVFSLMFPETEGYGLEDSAKSTMTQISTFVIIGECCHARRILAGSGDTGTAPPVLWQSRRQTNFPGAARPCPYARDNLHCHAENAISPNMSTYPIVLGTTVVVHSVHESNQRPCRRRGGFFSFRSKDFRKWSPAYLSVN